MGEDRHDFSKETAKRLCDRVGAVCSNPDCGASTKGPHSDGEKAISIGMACHIHAAASGGPRYDDLQTEDERRSIHNGIWLCFNCGKLIDTDPERFHAALLRKWKADAELEAADKLGRTAPAREAPTDATGGVRMSEGAAKMMCFLREAYVEAGFPNHKTWNFNPAPGPQANELRQLRLIAPWTMGGAHRLTDEGVDWIMRTRAL